MHSERDANLYNDQDFYQVLLADFLQANEDAVSDNESQDETEKRYLGNADLNITKRLLERKKSMKTQPKKDIDRRASKNRKIRYVVHDKILNFLPPRDNLQLFDGRSAILGNLFGQRIISSADARKRVDNDAIKLI